MSNQPQLDRFDLEAEREGSAIKRGLKSVGRPGGGGGAVQMKDAPNRENPLPLAPAAEVTRRLLDDAYKSVEPK